MKKIEKHTDSPYVFGKNNVTFSLFPLFQNGFVLSYDRRIVEKHWLKFSPIYYRKQSYSQHSKYADLLSMFGYGFRFQHKYIPYSNTATQHGLFLSYGPSFQRFNLITRDRVEINFDKYGLQCVIGFRKVFADIFLVEFYGGLAMDYLKNHSDENVEWRDVMKERSQMIFVKERKQLWLDYGVKGNYFVFGVNLGVLF